MSPNSGSKRRKVFTRNEIVNFKLLLYFLRHICGLKKTPTIYLITSLVAVWATEEDADLHGVAGYGGLPHGAVQARPGKVTSKKKSSMARNFPVVNLGSIINYLQ